MAAASNPSATARTTHTTLDRLGRMIEAVTPDPGGGLTIVGGERRENGGFVTTWEYDNLGNVASVTDGLGNTASFQYDSLNRIVSELSPHPEKKRCQDS